MPLLAELSPQHAIWWFPSDSQDDEWLQTQMCAIARTAFTGRDVDERVCQAMNIGKLAMTLETLDEESAEMQMQMKRGVEDRERQNKEFSMARMADYVVELAGSSKVEEVHPEELTVMKPIQDDKDPRTHSPVREGRGPIRRGSRARYRRSRPPARSRIVRLKSEA